MKTVGTIRCHLLTTPGSWVSCRLPSTHLVIFVLSTLYNYFIFIDVVYATTVICCSCYHVTMI